MRRDIFLAIVLAGTAFGCSQSDPGASDASADDAGKKKLDAGVDAVADGPSDASSCEQCGDACVDLTSDKGNCGGCGIDCTGGDCSGGVCTLANLDASATCLAIFQQKAFVTMSTASDAGTVFSVPTSGGGPTVASTTALASGPIVADSTDAYWAQWDSNVSYIQDALSATFAATNVNTAVQGASPLVHAMAMNDQNIAWLDESGNLCTSSRSFLDCAATPSVGSSSGDEYVALGGTSAFVTAGSGGNGSLCQIALPSQQNPSCALAQGASLGPIVVDDPNAASPNLYFAVPQRIMTATSVTGTWSVFASGGPSPIESLVYVDANTLYLGAATGVYKTSSGTIVPVVPNVHPTGRCLAVDAQSVYWLEGPRVRKAAR